MAITSQYDVRLEIYQISWLKRQRSGADSIRQALAAHIKQRRGQKTPRGYLRALYSTIDVGDIETKNKYSVQVYIDQVEWLRDSKRNGSAEFRRALDVYIVWRGMGFKTIVRHKLKKKKRQSKTRYWTRLRPDQIEWMRTAGDNSSEIIRTALSMRISWGAGGAGSPELYAVAARGYTPGAVGTISFEVRLDPAQYKWVSHAGDVIAALDTYIAWRYITDDSGKKIHIQGAFKT